MKKIIVILAILLSLFSVKTYAETGVIVKFKDGYTPDSEVFEVLSSDCNLYFTELTVLPDSIMKNVEYTEKNSYLYLEEPVKNDNTGISLMTLPYDKYYGVQWQLQMIKPGAFWKAETYGNEIRVGVLDSGCSQNPDLVNNLLPGKNYFDNSQNTDDGYGHGTHVAGIIAAEMNDTGITGIAPKSKIVPLKVFNDKGNSVSMAKIIKAIDEAVSVFECDVINMSWGTPNNDSGLKSVLKSAYDKGVILVAACGNDNNSTLQYPAAYDFVIGVGSVDQDRTKSWFSQYNNSVHVVTAGNDVLSTNIPYGYIKKSGTSQATPFVAGLAALALSCDASLTPERFKTLLAETAEDLGTPGYDTTFGYGLVNCESIFEKLNEGKSLYYSPVNFDGEHSWVYLKNNGRSVISGSNILAEYHENRFVNCCETTFTLMPGSEMIYKKQSSEKMKYFLWDSLDGMKPIK